MRFLFGFGAHDALRFDDLVSRVHPDDRARMLSEVASAQAAGVPFQGEFRTVLPNGEERWVLAKGRVSTDLGLTGISEGSVSYWISPSASARRKHWKTSGRFSARSSTSIRTLSLPKTVKGDSRWRIVPWPTLYGTTVENLIGKTDADFNRNAEQVESFQLKDLEVIDTLQERFIAEEQITDARGTVRWLQTVKRPIIESDGRRSKSWAPPPI